jgi:1,4-dihydroxy-6-naphthoate synthase
VNEYSVDLGADGRRAVELLFARAAASGITPPTNRTLFLD